MKNIFCALTAFAFCCLIPAAQAKRAPDLPIRSPGELVTLASIVEKETSS